MTSVPYVFETLSRYFESRQYRNPGQDASGKNDTYGHPIFTVTFDQFSTASLNKTIHFLSTFTIQILLTLTFE